MKRILQTLSQKWPEYLLEILVITIGILGAFSLNNWNEYRNERGKEFELLTQIGENIRRNNYELNESIKSDLSIVNTYDMIANAINNAEAYRDSVGKMFRFMERVTDPTISYSAYDALKDVGLEVIQSATLREEIVNLFEMTYRDREEVINEVEIHVLKPSSSQFVYENFYVDPEKMERTPNDYNALIKSDRLKNLSSLNRTWTLFFIQKKQECLEESQRVLSLIERELSEL